MLVRDWVETRSDTSKVWGNLRTLQQLTTRDADTDRARAASGKDGRSNRCATELLRQSRSDRTHRCALIRTASRSSDLVALGRTCRAGQHMAFFQPRRRKQRQLRSQPESFTIHDSRFTDCSRLFTIVMNSL